MIKMLAYAFFFPPASAFPPDLLGAVTPRLVHADEFVFEAASLFSCAWAILRRQERACSLFLKQALRLFWHLRKCCFPSAALVLASLQRDLKLTQHRTPFLKRPAYVPLNKYIFKEIVYPVGWFANCLTPCSDWCVLSISSPSLSPPLSLFPPSFFFCNPQFNDTASVAITAERDNCLHTAGHMKLTIERGSEPVSRRKKSFCVDARSSGDLRGEQGVYWSARFIGLTTDDSLMTAACDLFSFSFHVAGLYVTVAVTDNKDKFTLFSVWRSAAPCFIVSKGLTWQAF